MPKAVKKAKLKPKRKPTMVTEKEPPKAPPPPAAKPDEIKTEQEKGKKDPVDKAVPPSPIPESIEDLGIGPRDPYPSKEK